MLKHNTFLLILISMIKAFYNTHFFRGFDEHFSGAFLDYFKKKLLPFLTHTTVVMLKNRMFSCETSL
jgi:hypothetical protein